jgi:hypothetical protein
VEFPDTVVFKINKIFIKAVSERLIMILVHKGDGMYFSSSKNNLKFVCERSLNGTLLGGFQGPMETIAS